MRNASERAQCWAWSEASMRSRSAASNPSSCISAMRSDSEAASSGTDCPRARSGWALSTASIRRPSSSRRARRAVIAPPPIAVTCSIFGKKRGPRVSKASRRAIAVRPEFT
ncbi:hypothetical protein QWZ10_15570 [Paracoccus cavernae]|uniref:Uncharacterized protein n=1 Tax=Paracoccus cavernae TaxID=1571207 RepID=A0ABT8DBL2_9RHOB|nr:hypothetical protein [Paracoccus cavernae]